MAGGYYDIVDLSGTSGLQASVLPVAAGLFGLLGLQGIIAQSVPPGVAGYRLYSLTGVVLPEMGGPAAAKILKRDCNWGSWCKHFTVPIP